MENDWKNSLSFDDKGNLTKSISNYRAIFTHDENLSQIRFDTFCQDDISFSPKRALYVCIDCSLSVQSNITRGWSLVSPNSLSMEI